LIKIKRFVTSFFTKKKTYKAKKAEPGEAALSKVVAAVGQACLPVMLKGPHIIEWLRDNNASLRHYNIKIFST
jgi:hypothetical protein